MKINTLCVFGTRPEAIKMAPLIKQLQACPRFSNKVCVTGQHQQMLKPLLDLFHVTPDFDLDVMKLNQNLSELTSTILSKLHHVFERYRPDIVFTHGDTTTNLAAALSAYYHQIPIAHVEAGLRTGHLNLPWPEEANRKLSDALANLHFAPTERARLNLLQEGLSTHSIHVTGNTVIDALHESLAFLDANPDQNIAIQQQFSFLSVTRKMVLVTGHRRENFGDGLERICHALIIIAQQFPDVDIVYPVHLNPNVQEPVMRLLKNIHNIFLIDPVDYLPFVYLMRRAYFILTDSGGIQEEAPSLGKPVLVMRDATERPEALEAGVVKLVGTDTMSIVTHAVSLLTDDTVYQRMSCVRNPYGDGQASMRIVRAVEAWFDEQAFTSLLKSCAINLRTTASPSSMKAYDPFL